MPRRFVALPATPAGSPAGQVYLRCPSCGEYTSATDLGRQAMVCPWCDFHLPLAPAGHLRLLADEGSFQPLECAPAGPSLFGRATLAGRPLALALSDPTVPWTRQEFRTFVALAEAARLEHRTLLWVAAAPQAVDMALWPGLQAALAALRRGGSPWIVLLGGPCHGPLAALLLQADLVLAEPGANPDSFPAADRREAGRLPSTAARRPRHLLRAGWADSVLSRGEQRAGLALLLGLLDARAGETARPAGHPTPLLTPPPQPLAAFVTAFFELHGDRCRSDDPALLGGLARLPESGRTVLLLAAGHGGGRLRPVAGIGAAGWRKATRLLGLAGRLQLPVVTLLGPAGPRLSRREPPAELAAALGGTLEALLSLPVLTVAVLLGGASGPAGRVLRTADCLLATADAAEGLSPGEVAPEEVLPRPADLPAALARRLEELVQTYALSGPLGRRKLLERRQARWTRCWPGGEGAAPPQAAPAETE